MYIHIIIYSYIYLSAYLPGAHYASLYPHSLVSYPVIQLNMVQSYNNALSNVQKDGDLWEQHRVVSNIYCEVTKARCIKVSMLPFVYKYLLISVGKKAERINQMN